jgi:LDH2 family malate/lactate/ureidoglycolate dehydrogenase
MHARIPIGRLRDWAADVLQALEVPTPDARVTAELLLRADARGLSTHGISRLPSYAQKLRDGEVNARPSLRLHERPGLLTVDADGALGQVAGTRAVDRGLALLPDVPVVICQLRECGHFGALGLYALRAAEAGAMAVVAQRTPPLVSMPGLLGPVIGNNPLAFACPVQGQPPLVADMASSVAARGHILLRARTGEAIPEGWAVDEYGEPTVDAKAALGGALLPSGGHKGIVLAMLVEVLAGALTATPATVRQVSAQPKVKAEGATGRQGAMILLVNTRMLGSGSNDGGSLAADYLRAWSEDYLRRGGPNSRLPGRRGAALEQLAQSEGIEVGDALLAELRALGDELELPLPR